MIEITNEPQKVRVILLALKKDAHFSKTFDSTIQNGSISGAYTTLALLNGGIVIGYVRIKGEYNLEEGSLKLAVMPTGLFWVLMSLSFFMILPSVYSAVVTQDMLNFVSAFLFLAMSTGWFLGYKYDKRSFLKRISMIDG